MYKLYLCLKKLNQVLIMCLKQSSLLHSSLGQGLFSPEVTQLNFVTVRLV